MIVETRIAAGDWSAIPDPEGLVVRAVAVACASAELAAAPDAEVSVVLADDAFMRRLNRDFRGRDKATNVLSFPQIAMAGGVRVGLVGDIALGAETIGREARAQQKPLPDHLTHLVVHGLLHLFGYDHESDEDARAMEQLERRILAALQVPDPYDDTTARADGVDAA